LYQNLPTSCKIFYVYVTGSSEKAGSVGQFFFDEERKRKRRILFIYLSLPKDTILVFILCKKHPQRVPGVAVAALANHSQYFGASYDGHNTAKRERISTTDISRTVFQPETAILIMFIATSIARGLYALAWLLGITFVSMLYSWELFTEHRRVHVRFTFWRQSLATSSRMAVPRCDYSHACRE